LDFALSEEFGHGEVLEVVVIGDNIYWSQRSFEVIMLNFKSFEDDQKFLVMYIIV